MGKSKDLATGETRFVNTAGDTMTGNLSINNASGSQVTLHRTDTTIANDDLYGQIILSGDDADTNASGTRGYIRGRSQGSGGGLKMEFGTAGGGVAMGSDPRMTINADGIVTMPNQPKFKVRRNSSSVTLTGNNAKQNLVFNVKDFDIGNGYNTTTGKYTVPATGVYFFFLNPRFDGITGSTYARGLIYKGASIPGSPWSDYGNVLSSIDGDGHSTNYHTMNVSGIFSCVAGDTINFLGGGNVDSSITFQAESQAGGFMIG